jgi:shikimate kinase
MKTLILIGFRGAGKTSCGRSMADILQWNFFDTDEIIERDGKSIVELAEEIGMNKFREKERVVLENCLAEAKIKEGCIISCGGGIVDCAETVEILRSWANADANEAKIIWINVSLEIAQERLNESGPRIGGHLSLTELLLLYNCRLPIYESLAHFKFENHSRELSRQKKMILNFLKTLPIEVSTISPDV